MLPDINKNISHPELYAIFIAQLTKDFDNCSLDTSFIEEMKPDYDLMLNSLSNKLQYLLKQGSFKLNELMYRIDISEQQINKLSKAKPSQKFENIIAELIIKRILQKVVIKQYHKMQTKKID